MKYRIKIGNNSERLYEVEMMEKDSFFGFFGNWKYLTRYETLEAAEIFAMNHFNNYISQPKRPKEGSVVKKFDTKDLLAWKLRGKKE
jgi:hypothetical protein